MELLDALLINKERYGYMACPCRLAAEDREKDRDIICPCVYREPDVAEFGSCYLQPVRFQGVERGNNRKAVRT